jgi:DHA2 family multidrug resistance protein-like MFS transporter
MQFVSNAVMTAVVAPKAGRREWLGLAAIALPCLLYSMDLTVLNLALPRISADLRPTSAQLLWIVDIYGFVLAGLLITMGTLGDRIGRRRLLLIGAAAFGAGSVLAAFSQTAEMLIATRALLGLAGATLAPSTLSLVRSMFLDEHQRTVAISVWISSYSVGAAIGPFVGGVLLEYFWWGSVFLIGVPVMVALLVLGPVLLPEFKDPDAGRLDLASAMLSLTAVLSVIYGLKQMAQDGPGWLSAASIMTGVGVGAAFVRRQQTMANPLIDLQLFRAPRFSASLAAYTVATFVAFGVFVFIGQYLQLVLGLSPWQAGLWTMPFAAAFIVGSMLTPMIARRMHPALLMTGGLVLAAIGFGMLTQVDGTNGLPMLVSAIVVYSLGLAPVFTLATDMMVGSAPPERAGAASAISETGSEFGGALGIAILGSLGTAVYRSEMAHASPMDVPVDAMDAARSTLGAAVAVAQQLPGQLAGELTALASGAFTVALEVTAISSAGIVIMTAILTAMLVRRAQTALVTTLPDGHGHWTTSVTGSQSATTPSV